MECCFEDAMLNTLRDLPDNPIPAGNHFLLTRECKDCIPYLVLKVVETPGLRTSDTLQLVQAVEVTAYFSDTKKSAAHAYRTLFNTWFTSSGCLDLDGCGCFCVRNTGTSRITAIPNGMLRFSAVFTGVFNAVQLESGSV